MLDSYNQQQIEKISYEILKRAKALDVFPTPIEKIISQADLIVANHIDLSQVKQSFFERLTDGAKFLVKDIRGVLDRQQRVIYLDMSVGEQRKNFVKLHETGHDLLPWQSDIIKCLDDDDTLSPEIEMQFEAEANFFASLTLFQHDRFDAAMNKLPLGIAAAKYLSKTFGSSIHAALRRFVERTAKRCALLILEKPSHFPTFSCKIRNYLQSSEFTATFGELIWEEELSERQGWSFIEMYACGKKYSEDGEITLASANDTISLKYHYFNNSYNAFILLFPDGENTSTSTKIIVTNSKK